jgi:hypothetical protein
MVLSVMPLSGFTSSATDKQDVLAGSDPRYGASDKIMTTLKEVAVTFATRVTAAEGEN